MRLLLDTHIVLWQLAGTRSLSSTAQEAIADAAELLFSVVSFAEIGIKVALGKLAVPHDLRRQVAASGVHVLPLSAEHGLRVADLPLHHRDPFDRLLIAQAQSEQLRVITADRRFGEYDVPVIHAG